MKIQPLTSLIEIIHKLWYSIGMLGDIFNTIVLKPVLNFLLIIINYIPGHNFGLAIIIFTTAVSLALWPSKKKQLHQSKLMQKLQPEVDKIKKATKGDKQKQQVLLMELYKENGVNPVGSLGSLIFQMPIFIAVINSVRHLTQDVSGSIAKYGYGFIEAGYVKSLMDGSAKLNTKLAGVDLSLFGYHTSKFYTPLVILAALTAALQYIQIKQTMPRNKDGKKLKDILKSNKQPEAADISASMNKNMAILMPALIGWICLISQGASALYFFTSALISILQQKMLFKQDADEMGSMNQIITKPIIKDASPKKTDLKPAKKKSSLKDKLVEKATERAQAKAFKPVQGVKVRLVGQQDDSSPNTTNKLRGGKK